MVTCIALISFTEQGIRNVKDTVQWAEALKETAAKLGVTVKAIYWTLGQYDVIATLEGAGDAPITAVTLAMNATGNIRSQTLRAYSAGEMQLILDEVAWSAIT
ncbi:MAG: GYD domain-containing protein [Rhodomicrobium sp.]